MEDRAVWGSLAGSGTGGGGGGSSGSPNTSSTDTGAYVEEAKAANKVRLQIEAIGAADTLEVGDVAAVQRAEDAFNNLNDLEKNLVPLASRNALKAMVTTINTNAQTAENIAEQFSKLPATADTEAEKAQAAGVADPVAVAVVVALLLVLQVVLQIVLQVVLQVVALEVQVAAEAAASAASAASDNTKALFSNKTPLYNRDAIRRLCKCATLFMGETRLWEKEQARDFLTLFVLFF